MLPADDHGETFAQVFGTNVRTYRKARGMKQEDLGQSSGYDDHTIISKIEKGKAVPSLEKAFVLARVLQKPLEAFVVSDLPPEQLLMHLATVARQWPLDCRKQFVAFLLLLAEILAVPPQSPS